jgi:tetratricopeptide (TPR) repeat protein
MWSMKEKRFAWLEKAGRGEWKFEFSREKWNSDEDLDDAIDSMESRPARSERIFRKLIEKFPYQIDAYHHLAILLGMRGEDEEALKLRKAAVELALALFPKEFELRKDRLEWGWMENRPFLRVYEGLAIDYQSMGDVRRALEMYEDLLSLNPNDNQGCRCSAVWCYFELDDPDGVLKVCERYPKDSMPEISYGRALALLQKGRENDAEAAFELAIKDLPKVGHELARKKHRKVVPERRGYITVGGRDQAYAYWVDFGGYWRDTKGAIEFVRKRLEDEGLRG